MKRLFFVIIIITSFIFINCNYEPIEDNKPSLLASMNNPDDDPDDEAFKKLR